MVVVRSVTMDGLVGLDALLNWRFAVLDPFPTA